MAMEMRKLIFIALSVMLLFFIACEKEHLFIKLPEIAPMTFEIPEEMRAFYEEFHKKGDGEFTYEEFFSEQVRIPRPPFEKETKLEDEEKLIQVKTALGKFEEAAELVDSYLEHKKEAEDALTFAGHYYLERNRIDQGIELLLKRAQIAKEPRYWMEIIGLAEQQNMIEAKFDYLDQLIGAFPDSSAYYRMRMGALKKRGDMKELRVSLEAYYDKFPGEKRYYLQEMWFLYDELNQLEKGIALYERELNPLNDGGATSDLFALLDEKRMLRDYQKRWKRGRDKKTKLLHFLVSVERGNWEDAEEAIDAFAKDYPEETYVIGRLYKRIGYPRNAYDYYLRTIANKGESEQLLFEIFSLLAGSYTGSVCYNTKPSTEFIFPFDTDPGASGGLLSLFYNTLNYEARQRDFSNVKGQFINVSFMYELFSYIVDHYPETPHEDSLYVLIMRQLNRFKLHDHVVQLGSEYEKKKRKAVSGEVYELLAEAYYGLEDMRRGNETYRALLALLSGEERFDEYHAAFERFIAKLISQRNYEACTKLYWEEIKKHPEDRYLYERFLSLIYNYNLYDEELKVYRYAIQHFNEKSWYHKIARWYIRHKSESAFRSQTKRIREIFDDHELEAYLREFVHFDSRKSFYDPGNRFYLAMYTYGMDRFPDNAAFAKGLVRFYRTDEIRYERELLELYKKYFFADAEFRELFLRSLSKKEKLKEYVRRAEGKNGVLYTLFLAEAYRYLSYDERAEKPLRHLTVLYPDRLEFAERLGNLYRSIDFAFYHEERELTEKGVAVFLREISLFPTVDTLYVQLGEMLVEANRYERAKQEWLRRIELYPGVESVYLNVATILWDYYDFEDAEKVIKQAREVFANDTLLAKEMGVIYEELDDYEQAIREYIHASLSGEYYYYEVDEAIGRLYHFTEVHDLGGSIKKQFMSMIKKSETPHRIVRVYARYLEQLGLYEEKLKMYEKVLPYLEDPYSVREILSELEATEESVLIIEYAKRLVAITGEIDDYLLLAAAYENQKNSNKAKSVYDDLLKTYDDERDKKQSIMLSYSEFLWRHEQHARSLDMLFKAQEISKGYTKESILSDIAYRALSVDDFRRAKRAFALLLEADPYNVNYFNLAGDMYAKLRDDKELERVYLERISFIKKAPLAQSRKRQAVKTLYLGLARHLKELKKETRAQDYYIETINRDPDDVSLLDEVYTFSKKENIVDRLIAYYKKTAEKSFKDYRWQMVLVRFYMREGTLNAAAEQLRNAASNQPQMARLHEELADVLSVQGAFEEAIDEYEKAYALTKGKSGITRKIALLYLRHGEKEKMFGKMDELIQSKPKGAGKFFDVSEICLAYGLDEEAYQYALKGKEELEKHAYRGYLSDHMLSILSEAYLKNGRGKQLMRFLAKQYKHYYNDTKKEESYLRSEAYTRSSRIRYFVAGRLAAIWNDFSESSERAYLNQEFDGFSSFAYYSDIVRAYTQFAAQAEVPGVVERILLAKYNADKIKSSYPSMYEITNFYETRGAFTDLYDFLSRESRDHARLALLARITAPDEELKWLRKYYDERVYDYEKYSSTFSGYSPLIERYLDLLTSRGMEKELSRLLRSGASCNGQIVNYFFTRGDGKRAFQIIDDGFASKSEIWQKVKKAYVSFQLNYRKDDGVRYFKEILDIRPIGEKLEERNEKALFGRDFYVNSFFYGAHDSTHLFAGVEAAPRNSSSFHHLGHYFAGQERYPSARDNMEKAIQLSPNENAYIELAKIYRALRDKGSALDVLKHIDAEDFYSKGRYINALVEVGFHREAEGVLSDYLRKHIDTMNYSDTKQALSLTSKLMKKRATFLKELSQKVSKNENFYAILLSEEKIDDMVFYIKRYLALIERGRARKDFYRRQGYVERLSALGRYSDALDLIADSEQGISPDSLPEWLFMSKAEIYIETGKNREAVALLNDFVGGKEYIANSNEILRLLDLAGKEGLALKEYLYGFLIAKGWRNDAYYLGLAEVYLERGETVDALETLNELALRSGYGYRELHEIAQLLFKYEKNDECKGFLEKAMSMNPGFAEGRLLKAELLIREGARQKGCELALAVIREKHTAEIKENAYRIVEHCGETALPVIDRLLLDGASEGLYIAKARVLQVLNRESEAVAALKRCREAYPFASSSVHRLMATLTRGNESIEHLYDALYLKADAEETILNLVLELIKLERDGEAAMLMPRSSIDPSAFVSWYDTENAKREYLEKVRELIVSTGERLTREEEDNEIFDMLSPVIAFCERREDFHTAAFVGETLISLRKDEKLAGRIDELRRKARDKEEESVFIIKEDIANGEVSF